MNSISFKAIVLFLTLFVSSVAWPASDADKNRPDERQAQIDSPKKEGEEIRGAKKERPAPPALTEEVKSIPLSSTIPVRLYGFISAEAMCCSISSPQRVIDFNFSL